jgi:hypothetical protein
MAQVRASMSLQKDPSPPKPTRRAKAPLDRREPTCSLTSYCALMAVNYDGKPMPRDARAATQDDSLINAAFFWGGGDRVGFRARGPFA